MTMKAVVGYVRVSADADPSSGDMQVAAIKDECRKRGFELVGVVRETEMVDDDDLLANGHTGLAFAMGLVDEGLASGVVTADARPLGARVT